MLETIIHVRMLGSPVVPEAMFCVTFVVEARGAANVSPAIAAGWQD